MPNFNQQGYTINQDAHIQSDIRHLFDHIFNQKHQLDYSLLKKYLFVVEACEHREHFLLYDTDYALVTNVERDHVDYYHTQEQYREVFVALLRKVRYKTIVTNLTLQSLQDYNLEGTSTVLSLPYELDFPYLIGSYTSSNAGMVISLCSQLYQIPEQFDRTAVLTEFRGVGRRMEYIASLASKPVYSDYGHHAPALLGNIQALKKQFPDRKIAVVFQPHQAQRVLAGWDDFADVLHEVDWLRIYRLYTAREDFATLAEQYPRLALLSSFDELGKEFAQALHAEYCTDIQTIISQVSELSDDYVIVYFSAGDLDEEMRAHLLS